MRLPKAFTCAAVLPVFVLGVTACGNNDDDQDAATPDHTSSTSPTPYSPAMSNLPSDADTKTYPLSGGAAGGAQAPTNPATAAPAAPITDADRDTAKNTAREISAAYGAGGSHSEWFQNLAPHLTPSMQKTIEDVDPEPLKMNITGDPKIVNDPDIQADNQYWVTVSVPTNTGEWVVKLNRTAQQPDTWKAEQILPASVWAKGVNSDDG